MTTSEIVNNFVEKVDKNKTYSLDELKKLLSEAYKGSSQKGKKSSGGNNVPKEKKPPSAYNIFIKDEIQKIKQEDPNVDTRELMKMAAGRWKEKKALNSE